MAAADPYDLVAYPSRAFAQTHPDRLASIAMLCGMQPAAPSRCRYLDVGCGSGINLISMAERLPASRFVGIDLAQQPISEAVRAARELQLSNVEFLQGDLAALGSTGALGEFDYIVAHGVYSWVPAPVREALLGLCRDHLAAQGVTYISYNAYPGCHVRQMMRDMMRFHVHAFSGAQERLEQGLALIAFLDQAHAQGNLYGEVLHQERERLQHLDERLIFHDDLAQDNQPCYFSDFMEAAAGNGLQFLSEAALAEMQDLALSPEARSRLREFAGDLIQREQYLDYLTSRSFRQTLLCRRNVALDRVAAPRQALQRMRFASDARRSDGGGDAASVRTYARPPKAELTTQSPVAQAVLELLARQWPAAWSFQQLLRELPGAAGFSAPAAHADLTAPTAEALASALLDLVSFAMVDQRLEDAGGRTTVGDRPRASGVARWQARQASTVTALNHATVTLDDDFQRQLLPLLDGGSTREQLAAALAGLVRDGTLAAPPTLDRSDAPAVRQAVGAALERALERLNQGMLLG